MSKNKRHIYNFIKNLQDENFYDAHEDLERIWFARRFEESDEVKLLKGFINASVSFELLKKNRPEASKKVWKTYLKYRDLIDSIESKYTQQYRLIIEEIEKIKKNL